MKPLEVIVVNTTGGARGLLGYWSRRTWLVKVSIICF